jgi:hypothetical protein
MMAEGEASATRRSPESWLDEMKITFDSEELACFFDGFDPLELEAEGLGAEPEG